MKISKILDNREINIYLNEAFDELPIIINNSFDDDGHILWDYCQKMKTEEFCLVNISRINWNNDLTPWYCKQIFKGEKDYLGLADDYLEWIEKEVIKEVTKNLKDIMIKPSFFAISGYSLGGLFADYALHKSKLFTREISGSGSFWYSDYLKYVENKDFKITPKKIYFSLGNKEKETKNKIMSMVEENTLKIIEIYKNKNLDVKFEFNEGGHFEDSNKRLAKGIKWILE